MIKKILTVLLFLAMPYLTAQSQSGTAVNMIWGAGAPVFYASFSGLDTISGNATYSQAFDLSIWDNNSTVYLTYEYLSASSATGADSINIKLQPVIPELGTGTTVANMFGLATVDSTGILTSSASSSIAYSSSTVAQTTITYTKWSQKYRIVVVARGVAHNRKGATLKVALYSKVNDVTSTQKSLVGARY